MKEYYNDNYNDHYNDQLIFEGEYLFGLRKKGIKCVKGFKEYLLKKKWNGFGYDKNRKVIYQIKNWIGTVKEYYPDRNIIYEGEHKKGKKEGNGTQYFSNGSIKFEGKFKNDKRWDGTIRKI